MITAALCLAALAVRAAAQDAAGPAELEGRWLVAAYQVTSPDGEAYEETLPDGITLQWTFEGRRFIITDDTVFQEESALVAGTFEASGGVLRLSPEDDEDPVDLFYTFEGDTLRIFMNSEEGRVTALILRRISAAAPEADGPTELEGRWLLESNAITGPEGEVLERPFTVDAPLLWTFEGRRFAYTLTDPDSGELLDSGGGTFRASGGILRTIPEGRPSQEWHYAIEENALRVFTDPARDTMLVMIFRRQ
jgi:hypothetical protein